MKGLWYQKGSFTVEAALIIPLLLGVAFMLLYLILFFHDKMYLQGEMNDKLSYLAEKRISPESITKKEAGKNLLAVQINKADFSSSLGTVKGEIRACSRINIPVIKILMHSLLEFQIKGERRTEHPERIKRYLNFGKRRAGRENGTD